MFVLNLVMHMGCMAVGAAHLMLGLVVGRTAFAHTPAAHGDATPTRWHRWHPLRLAGWLESREQFSQTTNNPNRTAVQTTACLESQTEALNLESKQRLVSHLLPFRFVCNLWAQFPWRKEGNATAMLLGRGPPGRAASDTIAAGLNDSSL